MSTVLRHRLTGAEITVDGDEQVAYWERLGYRAATQPTDKPTAKKATVKKTAAKKR